MILRNRSEAGLLLSRKLRAFKGSDAVVVAIPHGGIQVGYSLALALDLPLQVALCKRIEHPASKDKSIGSVSLCETIIHSGLHDIPQGYIARQIQEQKKILEKQERVFGKNLATDLKGKSVIVVDDLLLSGDTMLAFLRGMLKQAPEKVIVAVSMVSPSGLEVIQQEVDDVVYLEMCPDFHSAQKNFEEFSAGGKLGLIDLLKN